jgi:hypothetical protein
LAAGRLRHAIGYLSRLIGLSLNDRETSADGCVAILKKQG